VIIAHKIPQGLPGGHLAFLTAKMLDGLAEGYLPLSYLCPLPPLYLSGIRYQFEPGHGKGIEDFANPWTTYARGWGDCDDLILYRLLELKKQGENAHTKGDWLGNAVHVVIRRGDGRTEDVSAMLGAPQPQRRF
jgi:hypothetical protein